MIDEPRIITQSSFQMAWKEAVSNLSNNNWELYNLVVRINDPSIFDDNFHQKVKVFCRSSLLLDPKDVAYTIFPHGLYDAQRGATQLFHSYNRERGMYDRLQHRPKFGWGTYFHRMTHYENYSGTVNQLENIIQAINARSNIHKSAYTILIQKPGEETIRPRGGPCLNYIAIQIEHLCSSPILGMLCVYRNHDFLKRAYGNYWGLCNLARFLATETRFGLGPITCVSSHAYIDNEKKAIRCLLATL
jgi:hypothetical protein